MRKPFTPKQLAEAKERITRQGQPVTEWCRERGLDYSIVSQTLMGRTRGLRGESFRAAVALGLRQAPKENAMQRVSEAA